MGFYFCFSMRSYSHFSKETSHVSQVLSTVWFSQNTDKLQEKREAQIII